MNLVASLPIYCCDTAGGYIRPEPRRSRFSDLSKNFSMSSRVDTPNYRFNGCRLLLAAKAAFAVCITRCYSSSRICMRSSTEFFIISMRAYPSHSFNWAFSRLKAPSSYASISWSLLIFTLRYSSRRAMRSASYENSRGFPALRSSS